jgi:hypothetical protein
MGDIQMELMQCHTQWANRPNDERYLDIPSMRRHFYDQRMHSRGVVVPSKALHAEPVGDSHTGLVITGPNGHGYAPSNWAFGQLATLADAPASYLRKLPSELASDCLNLGFQVLRQQEEVGALLYKNGGEPEMRAATGPKYGRIWNSEVLEALENMCGDGITGQWKIPGEFGRRVPITKENTTLYAGDRDMFAFLADEEHRIEVPNRRNGEKGTLSRGFFVWNSEVGASTFGLGTFLFDYACCNRIVWGAESYKELRIRHSGGAPERFLREVRPALVTYANSSAKGVQDAIQAAQADSHREDMDKFLASRKFTTGQVKSMDAVHRLEEGRPMESRWDIIVAATAVARGIDNQGDRVDLERTAGSLLTL